MLNVYIDESGNTGDLVSEKLNASFLRQNIFTLAGIQIEEKVADKFSKNILPQMKAKYNIQGEELKSNEAFKRPRFILDILGYLRNDINLYLEVLDKKFYICNSIVRHQIIHRDLTKVNNGIDVLPEFKQVYTDLLVRYLEDKDFLILFKCYAEKNDDTLKEIFSILKNFAKRYEEHEKDGELFRALLNDIISSEDDYNQNYYKRSPNDLIKSFLFEGDQNKYNKTIALLPHINCLTNIIARVNSFNNRNIKNIKFIHDEQPQFGTILEANVKSMYKPNVDCLEVVGADYNLESKPNITFDSKSHNVIGIQIADVIAGFQMRYVKYSLEESEKLNEYHHKLFEELKKHTKFMLAISDFKKLGFSYIRSNQNYDKDKGLESVYYNQL